jgi:hypothetical protein
LQTSRRFTITTDVAIAGFSGGENNNCDKMTNVRPVKTPEPVIRDGSAHA